MIYDFVPEQDFNGYAKPWPGGAGANKIEPVDTSLPYTNLGVTISRESDKAYKVKASSASGYPYVQIGEIHGLAAGDYVLSGTSENAAIVFRIVDRGASPIVVFKEGSGAFTLESDIANDLSVEISIKGASLPDGEYIVSSIQAEAGSTASSWTPYKNICPITGVDVPGIGTVYEGSIDTASRELTITHDLADLGSVTWNVDSDNNTFYCNLFTGQKDSLSTVVANAYCSAFKLSTNTAVSSNTEDGTIAVASGYNRVYYAKMVGATAAEFQTAMTGFKFVFELSTPVTVTLTEQQITALLGNLGIARNFNDAEIMINTWLYMAQGRDPSSLTRQVLRPISKPVIDKPISFDDVVKELPANDVISPDEEPEENITEEKEEEDNASE